MNRVPAGAEQVNKRLDKRCHAAPKDDQQQKGPSSVAPIFERVEHADGCE
jgi:hypothetical protein